MALILVDQVLDDRGLYKMIEVLLAVWASPGLFICGLDPLLDLLKQVANQMFQ